MLCTVHEVRTSKKVAGSGFKTDSLPLNWQVAVTVITIYSNKSRHESF